MALAPEISAFGDGDHEDGETGLTIDGGGFGAFPGSAWMFENADGSGAADELTVGGWNDIQLTGVEIPASLNNSPGTVYLRVQREDLAWSQAFAFTLSASGPDMTPNPFMFAPQFGVDLSTVIISESVTPDGFDTETDITVTGGEYSINGGAFTSSPGTIQPGDSVRLQHTSGDEYLETVETTVTIGGVAGVFITRTLSLFGLAGAGVSQIWAAEITGAPIDGPSVAYG